MATHLRIHLGKERELYEQPPLVPAAEQARVFGVLSGNGKNSTLRDLTVRVVQNLLGQLACCGLAVTMNDDAPVAQVFVERDFGDA